MSDLAVILKTVNSLMVKWSLYGQSKSLPPFPLHIIVGSVCAGVEPSHVFFLPLSLPSSLPPPLLRSLFRLAGVLAPDCDDDLSCLAPSITSHFPELARKIFICHNLVTHSCFNCKTHRSVNLLSHTACQWDSIQLNHSLFHPTLFHPRWIIFSHNTWKTNSKIN